MKKLRALIILVIALSSLTSFAKKAPNQLCQDSFFYSLKTYRLSFTSNQDVCLLSVEDFPAELKSTLLQMKDLNLAVSKSLNIDPKILYREGLKFAIAGNESGAISSLSGNISVYLDWKGGRIEPSVYIHEVGHVLLYLDRIPPITSLSRNIVFKESFPDILSNAVLNKQTIELEDETFPACAKPFRADVLDFNFSVRDLFGNQFNLATVKCCDSIAPKDRHPNFEAFCKMKQASLIRTEVLPLHKAIPSDCFTPREPFIHGCSFYIFAAPLDRFLDEMEQLTGKNKLQLLQEAGKIVKLGGDYECKNVVTGRIHPPGGSAIQSFHEVLVAIRESLDPVQMQDFDRIAKDFNLKFVNEVDDLDVKKLINFRLGNTAKICLANEATAGCDFVCQHKL